MPDSADQQFRTEVRSKLDAFATALNNLQLLITEQNGKFWPSDKIEDAIQQRAAKLISADRYEGDLNGLSARVARLEGGPSRIQPWLALLVTSLLGCLGTLLTIISVSFGILTWIITHPHG